MMIDAAIDKNSPISHVAVVLNCAIVLSPNIGGTNGLMFIGAF